MDEKRKFLAEKVLKRTTNEFLKEIENLMEIIGPDLKVKKGKQDNKKKRPGRGQFKALMDAAAEASCIGELLLFLSYQESKNEGWDYKYSDGESIAEKVAASFGKVQNVVYEEIKQEDGMGNITDEDERILRLAIAEKYLGYLYWKASAVSKEEKYV